MSDLFALQHERRDQAIEAVAAAIAERRLDRPFLNQCMRAMTGGNDAGGAWTQRDSFELMEQGLCRHLLTQPPARTLERVAAMAGLAETLPTQTVRSETQIAFQQFSTPADLAALAIVLAQPAPGDIVLEPSAGNGLLVAQLGAVATLHLNEIEPNRAATLPLLFPRATVSRHDGAQLAGLPAELRPTLIVMNPPFSRSIGRGEDSHAAARHLLAALRRLQPGGRCVAIMPDWFTNSAAVGAVYQATLRDVTVQHSLRFERCYARQGTSIAVRLLVIDKLPGGTTPTTVARQSPSALIGDIRPVPRQTARSDSTAPRPNPAQPSLFRAVRTATPKPLAIARIPEKQGVGEVAYTVLDQPRPLGEQVGVYLPYRPSRIAIAEACEHPTPLVESVAMGSIAAPRPSYTPRLPQRVLARHLLSEAQLETLIYAGSAWQQDLPGRFVVNKEGVGLTLREEGARYRRGYFLGDGTGAGKGRQLAATILANWIDGRRRAIWISKNEQLLEDARRDWSALGGLAPDVQPLSNWKIDETVDLAEGILFVTYPTLRSQRGDASRLDQIIAWAGAAYDGVIAFDEAHEMGGVAGGEGALGRKDGSQQGVAGVLLQNHLPRARVIYASATGASDVNNLAYAVRLGLWGPGTAFADREAFIADIRTGGIAAMELVARDLKATGLYAARALSFAGVEYEILKHDLTPEQIAIYDAYADAWAIIHRNMEEALALTAVVDELEGNTLNSGAKAAARSRFESTKQRFFGQVLLSMKLPSLIAAIKEHLANGQSVVVQLVSTAESILDRRLGALSPEERAMLEVDTSPVEYVIDYLQRAFPTHQMEIFADETGREHSRPMRGEDGLPIHNQEALARREHLIEQLCALPPIRTALDALIEHFGTEAVAEITGRTKRLVTTTNGEQKLEARSVRTTQADAAAFMNGRKRILVFSDAGGTGRSYHASLDALNKEQRVHFLVEPGWRADRAIQGLGRTHRTHQASTPLFRPVTTDCKGELRFTSTIARRLDSLGALTRGQRQTGGQNLFDPADNLESEYARAALVTWFQLLARGKLKSVTLDGFQNRTGLKLIDDDGVLVDDLPPIQRWLNRILALPIGLQNLIFDEFLELLEARIAAARDAGTLDLGVETIPVEHATVIEDICLRTDDRSGATTHLLTLEIATRLKPVSRERILDLARDTDSVFLVNGKSGRVALQLPARSIMKEDGTTLRRVALYRPTRTEYKLTAELAETAWQRTSRERFIALWDAEVEDASTHIETRRLRIATGLLLPIWSSLPKDVLTVNRIVDAEGRSWLGRIVPEDCVAEVLKTFGIEAASTMPPAEMAAAVLAGGSIELSRPWPLTIKRSRVNGDKRIEIVGAPAGQLPWFKSLGCWTEIIQYRTRLFAAPERIESLIETLLRTG